MTTPEYRVDPKGQRFAQLSLDDATPTIRMGRIGAPCLVIRFIPHPDDLERVRTIVRAYFDEENYRIATCHQGIIDGSHADVRLSTTMMDHPQFETLCAIGNMEWIIGQKPFYIMHFPEGLQLPGDFDIAEISGFSGRIAVLVDGDIRADGIFAQDRSTFPPATLVNGSIHAKSVIHHDSHMVVTGDIHVAQSIFGYYNHGSLRVRGNASGEALMSFDHDIGIDGEVRMFDLNFDTLELPDWMNPELQDLTDDDFDDFPTADQDKVHAFVRNGRSVLREGVVYRHTPAPQRKAKRDEPTDEATRSAFAQLAAGFMALGKSRNRNDD